MTFRMACVFAHPDDDTHCVGGLAATRAGDLDITLVVATSGEAGPIADPALAERENLAEVREGEERESLEVLGVGDAPVHFLRYPDSGLQSVPRHELATAIIGILEAARPDVVVTFGPEGVTRHADHIAVGQAATEAFHEAQAAHADGTAFRRLLYSSLPHSVVQRFWEEFRRLGMDVPDPEAPFMPRGVPDDTITIEVDCRSMLDTKVKALHAHRTQRDEIDFIPPALQELAFGTEWFVQAFPPVAEPIGPKLIDPFEGLDDG